MTKSLAVFTVVLLALILGVLVYLAVRQEQFHDDQHRQLHKIGKSVKASGSSGSDGFANPYIK